MKPFDRLLDQEAHVYEQHLHEAKLSAEVQAVRLIAVHMSANPSIERTSQRPLRALCAAAHVER